MDLEEETTRFPSVPIVEDQEVDSHEAALTMVIPTTTVKALAPPLAHGNNFYPGGVFYRCGRLPGASVLCS